jgi:hypothetical protein
MLGRKGFLTNKLFKAPKTILVWTYLVTFLLRQPLSQLPQPLLNKLHNQRSLSLLKQHLLSLRLHLRQRLQGP